MSRRKIKTGGRSRLVRIGANKQARKQEKKSLVLRLLDAQSANRSRRGECVACGLPLPPLEPIADELKERGKICDQCKRNRQKEQYGVEYR